MRKYRQLIFFQANDGENTCSSDNSKHYIDISNKQDWNESKTENELSKSVDNEDLVLAEYASSHSLLDSILSTIDIEKVSNSVEFPEFGKNLVENFDQSELDPVGMTRIVSRTWGDNWTVEGVDKFEEQVFLEVEGRKTVRKTLTPEVVPFLVPQSSNHPRVIIGGKDVDEVSVLSEKMSIGSIEYSSSENEEEDTGDFDVQNETIAAFLREETESNSTDDDNDDQIISSHPVLSLISAPEDTSVETGTILSLSCSVQGIKPIGKLSCLVIVLSCDCPVL